MVLNLKRCWSRNFYRQNADFFSQNLRSVTLREVILQKINNISTTPLSSPLARQRCFGPLENQKSSVSSNQNASSCITVALIRPTPFLRVRDDFLTGEVNRD